MSASGVSSAHMKVIWPVAAVIVLVFGWGVTPWDALRELLLEQGVSTGQQQLLAFTAGYTLPLTVGVAVSVLLWEFGALRQVEEIWRAAAVAGVLFVSGLLSTAASVGLAPGMLKPISGPPYVSFPLMVASSYLNTYGWSLAVCGVALGVAGGLQAVVWYRGYGGTA